MSTPETPDLFAWADRHASRTPSRDVTPKSRDKAPVQPTAVILDWCGPFAKRVMARIHEYDDDRPKPFYQNSVVALGQGERRRA